jgi:hypothetical protein
VGPPVRPFPDSLLQPPSEERLLRFAAIVSNRGDHPFDVLGAPADAERWEALQCVRWAARACLERRPAGTVIFHPEHGHWHLDAFVLYELRRVGADGEPDLSPEGLVVSSEKMSFCLQDSTAEEGLQNPPFYVGCTAVIQGISPGWADIYDSSLPGQELGLDGVLDGVYALVYTVNPDGSLYDADPSDDVAYSLIEISDGGTTATVVDG